MALDPSLERNLRKKIRSAENALDDSLNILFDISKEIN